MSSAGALVLTSGGLIADTGGTITGGTLRGSSAASGNAELIVIAPLGLTIGSVIADNGGATGLTKAGSGTLTLTGSNTYTGPTTLAAGILQIASGASIATSSGLLDNGELIFNHNDSATFSSAISGSGSILQTGGGTLTLLGNNSFTGATTVAAGTLQVGNGGSGASLGGSSGVLDSGVLVFNHNDSTEFDGVVSGNGRLTQMGGGVLILTASNTYSGGTTISSGSVQLGNGGGSGSLGQGR